MEKIEVMQRCCIPCPYFLMKMKMKMKVNVVVVRVVVRVVVVVLSTDLRLLLSAIVNSKDGVVVAFGLVCSTFITMSRGSTFRHYFLPEGDPNSLSVSQSNLLAARTNGLKL